jgi:excisionase family DNA binding protein
VKPQIILVSKLHTGMVCSYIAPPSFTGNPQHLWTVSEAAAFLRIHPETLREWVRGRTISYIRLGVQDVRFRREDIQEFLESRLNRRRSAFQ